jgi:hypothetical protein
VVGQTVQLDATGSTDPDGDPLGYAWDLDEDGVFDDAAGARPEVVFDEPGTTTVAVRVTDDMSATDVDEAEVTVDDDDGGETPGEEEPPAVAQIGPAEDNIASAIAWSQATTPSSAFASWWTAVVPAGVRQMMGGTDTVLLGRDDLFADSLASGGLQGILQAPLLLTDPAALDPRTAEELDRLAPRRVIVLGGPTAVDEAVLDQLRAAGYVVERRAGDTRVETAVAIAEADAPAATTALLARAHGGPGDPTQAFADALAAGALAAERRIPMLLTETERLSAATREWLAASDVEEVLLIGGEAAVSGTVEEEVEALGIEVRRLGGGNRFATAAVITMATAAGTSSDSTASSIAEERGAQRASDADRVILVDGVAADAWADAFPAALDASRDLAPIVLAAGDDLPEPTAAFLQDGGVPLVCGTTATPTACEAARQALAGGG